MMKFRYIESMLTGINDLMGGLPIGSILGLYGVAESGKTILAFHLLYDRLIEDKEHDAMVFDTEGSEYTYIEWLEKLNKRYDCDVGLKWVTYNPKTFEIDINDDDEKHDHYIYILDMRSIEHILSFHGRGCSLDISKTRHSREGDLKGGKIGLKPETTMWFENVWDAPIGKFITEHKIGSIVYDSLTNPLTVFGFEAENLPARTNATNWWLTRIQELAESMELVCIAVLHETANPQKAWERPHYEGGKAIEHNLKFVIYINHGKSSRTPKTPADDTNWNPTTRELRNGRHPSKKPFAEYVKLDLTDDGYVDLE